jgi:FAD:protein FMN transferase
MRLGLTRRRMLQVAAVAGLGNVASLGPGPARAQDLPPLWVWRGRALGAAASIRLHHPDEAAARALLQRCADEVERLERIFSLYRSDSALVALNMQGRLDMPPLDLVRLLAEAGNFSRLTDGAFDVTVQPLWERYAAHDWSDAGAALPEVDDLLPLIDWQAIEVEPRLVAFAREGMAVTLNGIAQGYITDRIVELLRDAGCRSVLADLGEIRGLGPPPDGMPWRVGLPGWKTQRRLEFANGAVATSSAAGTTFEPSGAANHLFDPHTGRCAAVGSGVSVAAPNAVTADAASTALAILSDRAPASTRAAMESLGARLL